MDKLPGLICFEKFIQIECILFNIVIRKLDSLPHLVSDNVRHLVREERQTGQILIRIFQFAGVVPVTLFLLLIRIGPVIDGIFGKFVIRQSFKRRSGKVKRVLTVDVIKCCISLVGIDTFMCLIDDQDIPRQAFFCADF